MNIINTHYIPLAEPHNIIMGPGEDMIDEQIGVLSVIEECPTKGGGYGIKTHEHPVVRSVIAAPFFEEKNGSTDFYQSACPADGCVWTDFECGDCHLLCSVKKRKIFSYDLSTIMITRLMREGEPFDVSAMIKKLKWYGIEVVWLDKAKENHQDIVLGNITINDKMYMQSSFHEPLFLVQYGVVSKKNSNMVHPLDDDEIFFEFVNQARAMLEVNPYYDFRFITLDHQLNYITDRLNAELNNYLERPDESK